VDLAVDRSLEQPNTNFRRFLDVGERNSTTTEI